MFRFWVLLATLVGTLYGVMHTLVDVHPLPQGWIIFKNTNVYASDLFGQQQHLIADEDARTYFARVSPDGRQLAITSQSHAYLALYTIGTEEAPDEAFAEHEMMILTASFAPDGAVVMQVEAGNRNSDSIRIYDAARSDAFYSPFAPTDGQDMSPDWSPDGASFVFTRVDANGHHALMIYHRATDTLVDVGAEVELPRQVLQARWSPDGSRIVFWGSPPDSNVHQLFLLTYPDFELRQVAPDADCWLPVWSPDGALLLAYCPSRIAQSWLIDPERGDRYPLPKLGIVQDWVSTLPAFE